MFIKNLRYLCLVVVIIIGLMTIVGTGGGDGVSESNSLSGVYLLNDFGEDSNGNWASIFELTFDNFENSSQPGKEFHNYQLELLMGPRPHDQIVGDGGGTYYLASDGTIAFSCHLCSYFGPRGGGWHHGTDYAIDIGTEIIAPADGNIYFARYMHEDDGGIMNTSEDGNSIIIQHTPFLRTIYCHLDTIFVSERQNILRGDVIALSGATGSLCRGPHLHFQVNRGYGWGDSTDPNPYWYGGKGYPIVFEKSVVYPNDKDRFTHPVSPDPRNSFIGVISPDQNICILSDTDSLDGVLRLVIGIKKSSGLSDAILDGDYVVNKVGYEGSILTSNMIFSFNGDGGVNYSTLSSSDGNNALGAETYSITSEGMLAISNGDEGIVSSDGSVFVVTDTRDGDGNLSLIIGVKKSFAMSNGILNGSYLVLKFGASPNVRTSRFLYNFDGNGNFTWQSLLDSNNGAETYSLNGDGTFNERIGVLNSDGSIFTIVDTDPADGDLSLLIGIKKS